MSDRRGTPGEGGARTASGGGAATDMAARRRPSADPEALSIAIGARREALERGAPAETAQDTRARPAVSVRGRAARRAAVPWRGIGAVAGILLLVVTASGAVYWAVPRMVPGSPGAAEAPANEASHALTRAQRREVERLLKRLDFRVGAVDGRIDPRTRAALLRYRRYQGMTAPHARVTPELLRELRAVAELAHGTTDAAAP